MSRLVYALNGPNRNLHEEFKSFVSKGADGINAGCGAQGHQRALKHLAKLIENSGRSTG